MCGSTTKGDVVKRSDCILVYGSTTKGDVVKRSDCTLVCGSTTKGDIVERFNLTVCTYCPFDSDSTPSIHTYIIQTFLHVCLISCIAYPRQAY